MPKLVDLGEEVAEQAMLLGRRKKITYYDAAYLALAKSLSAPLVTADQEQVDAARGYTNAKHLSSAKGLQV